MHLLDIATSACIGALVGVELAVSLLMNPIVWKLESFSQAVALRILAARLGKVMPAWYILTCFLLILEALHQRGKPGAGLLVAANVLWILTMIFTVVILVPVNIRLALINADKFTDGVKQEHIRWDSFHRVRIVVVFLAMICFLVGIHL
jgi:uncharacterized membrane protein